MFFHRHVIATTIFLLSFSQGAKASASDLHGLDIQPLGQNVYALVGEMKQRSPHNLGNNSTHGVVVLSSGVLLVDSGGSYQGAEAIDAAIDQITDKPVKWVINTGGQDHRWLGNGYFKAQGATIYASTIAVEDQRTHCTQKLDRLTRLIGEEKLAKTDCVYADQTFDETLRLTLDGVSFNLQHNGPAHTLGNALVWMPSTQTAFVGDMVYNERILGIQYTQDVHGWIATFEAMAALNPKTVVPGHGHAGDLAKAKADTYDYLVQLRDQVLAVIDDGGDMVTASQIDQSDFNYLREFDSLAGKNAQWAFERLEFE